MNQLVQQKKEVFGVFHGNKDFETRFTDFDATNGNLVDYAQECSFARQALEKNDFTMDVAAGNKKSLQNAILNVSSIGISLNPAKAHAYLVPRGKAICLDISYKGLTKLATDSGAIKWAKAELVYENDTFKWNGPASLPTHEADPFSERGKVTGGYCIAKLPDDSVLIETMKLEEIHKVQNVSKARSGPWVTWWEEMAKKTIIKRASKSWPQTENRARWDNAVHTLHESEGSAFSLEEERRWNAALKKQDGYDLWLMQRELSEEAINGLFNSFEKGDKSAGKERVRVLVNQGQQVFDGALLDMQSAIDSGDDSAISEILEEASETEKALYIKHLPALEAFKE